MTYKELFMRFWGITTSDYVACWRCGRKGVDICHIDQKGIGGREVDYEENLIPLCRECHTKTEGNTEAKKELWDILVRKIKQRYPWHEWSLKFKETWYYKNYVAQG